MDIDEILTRASTNITLFNAKTSEIEEALKQAKNALQRYVLEQELKFRNRHWPHSIVEKPKIRRGRLTPLRIRKWK